MVELRCYLDLQNPGTWKAKPKATCWNNFCLRVSSFPESPKPIGLMLNGSVARGGRKQLCVQLGPDELGRLLCDIPASLAGESIFSAVEASLSGEPEIRVVCNPLRVVGFCRTSKGEPDVIEMPITPIELVAFNFALFGVAKDLGFLQVSETGQYPIPEQESRYLQ